MRKENSGEFDEQIMADLIEQGYNGDELVKQFALKRAQIRPAVERILDEAKRIAESGDGWSYEDVFGE